MVKSSEIKATPTEAAEIAATLLRAGRPSEAEPILLRVLEIDPHHPDALHFLGMLRHFQGKSADSVELLRHALERAPEYHDARNNLGNVLRLMGRRDEAETEYRRILDADPSHAESWVNLGSLHRWRGAIEQALECYDRALELDPEDIRAWLNRASALRRAGRLDEAEAAYRRVLELQPQYAEAYLNLGRLLYRTRRYEEAAGIYRRWLELAPEHPVANHMLAACGIGAAPSRASDDFVRETFDAFAADFDETLEVLRYRAPSLVADAVAAAHVNHGGGLRIADAGCGTGLCGPLLRPLAGHLAGVDLSPQMVARARERLHDRDGAQRPVYDELAVAELTSWLEARPEQFDAVVAADVLVYFGALDEAFRSAATALLPGGIFVFTTERHEEDDSGAGIKLHPHGRYSHSEPYLQKELSAAGFAGESFQRVELRMELGESVAGTLAVARRH